MKKNKSIKRLIPLTMAVVMSMTATASAAPKNFFTLVDNKLVKFDLADLKNDTKKEQIVTGFTDAFNNDGMFFVGDDYGFAVDFANAGLPSYATVGSNSEDFAMQDSELDVFDEVYTVDEEGNVNDESISLANVEAPSISFEGTTDEDGNYTGDVEIILDSEAEASTIIYYTLDDSTPNRNSDEYDDKYRPVLDFETYKGETFTVKAAAINSIGAVSTTTTLEITFAGDTEPDEEVVIVEYVTVDTNTPVLNEPITATAFGADGATPTGTLTYQWYSSDTDIDIDGQWSTMVGATEATCAPWSFGAYLKVVVTGANGSSAAYKLENPVAAPEGNHGIQYIISNSGVSGRTYIEDGDTLTATFSASNGYELPSSITVTMGGETLEEGTDYTYDSTTGEFSLPNVTGDVTVTCTSVEVNDTEEPEDPNAIAVESVTVDTDNATIGVAITATAVGKDGATPTGTLSYQWYSSHTDIDIDGLWSSIGGETKATYTPTGFGRYLKVVVTGANGSSAVYKLENPVAAPEGTYGIHYIISNAGVSGRSYVDEGDTLTATFTAGSRHVLPSSITVTMGGETLEEGVNYTYDSTTGAFSLANVTRDVTITCIGVEGESNPDAIEVAYITVDTDSPVLGEPITATAFGADGATPTGNLTYQWLESSVDIDVNASGWRNFGGTVGATYTSRTGFGRYLMIRIMGENGSRATYKFEKTIVAPEGKYGIHYILPLTFGIGNGYGGPPFVSKGETAQGHFTAGDGYVLPSSITVTMGGETLTNGVDYTYDSETGEFSIPNITGDVTLDCVPIRNNEVDDTEEPEEPIEPEDPNAIIVESVTVDTDSPALYETITATAFGVDGAAPTGTIKYEWYVADEDIDVDDYGWWHASSGATKTPRSSEVGQYLKVVVSGANGSLATYKLENPVAAPEGAYVIKYITSNAGVSGVKYVYEGDTLTATFYSADEHIVPQSITVTMGDETLIEGTDYTYDSVTGDVVLPNVTGDVTITCVAISMVS